MGIERTRPSRPTSVGAGAGLTRHQQELTHKKPAYKVVYEQLTQKKKKLEVKGAIQVKPPAGYTFVPAGNATLTNECKEYARLAGEIIFTVNGSSKRKSKNSKGQEGAFAQFTQRIGYHFPSAIVDRVAIKLGIDASAIGTAKTSAATHRPGKSNNAKVPNKKHTRAEQNELDEEAREALKDLFPAIPKQDLDAIVKHAFDLRSERVGTAELTIARRVQLAVIAHIRHVYTKYDNFLKDYPWQAARQMVQKATLSKCAEWRGEDGTDDEEEGNAMEDILREVIVISEDEDEDGDEVDRAHHKSRPRRVDDDETSVIILDAMEAHPINYGELRHDDPRSLISPEPDGDLAFQALGNGQYVISHRDPLRDERNSARRLRAWAETRGRAPRPSQAHEVAYELDRRQVGQRPERSLRILVPEHPTIGHQESSRVMARPNSSGLTCIPLSTRGLPSGTSVLEDLGPLRDSRGGRGIDHYEHILQPRQPRPAQPSNNFPSQREVSLVPMNTENFRTGHDTPMDGPLPSRQLFPVTEASKDTAFPSIETTPRSTRFRENEIIVISSPIRAPMSPQNNMISRYHDNEPAISHKRRLAAVEEDPQPNKRMSQDLSRNSAMHQTMSNGFRTVVRPSESGRTFIPERINRDGPPRPFRTIPEDSHLDGFPARHRQPPSISSTPTSSHVQFPLSPTRLLPHQPSTTSGTPRHDIITLSRRVATDMPDRSFSATYTPTQYVTTPRYRELQGDGHPATNGDRALDGVDMSRPLYEGGYAHDDYVPWQSALYSEPIRSESFHPSTKENKLSDTRDRRVLPLDRGYENGWSHSRPMASERSETLPVMRTITNTTHEDNRQVQDAMHRPIEYNSESSKAYHPQEYRFPDRREPARQNDRRIVESSQRHLAEAPTNRFDSWTERQAIVRAPPAPSRGGRVLYDRLTGREVFIVED